MDIVAVVSLFISGLVQKHLFSKLPNRAIPFVNAVAGTAAFYFLGDTPHDVSTALVAGSVASATATGIHQAIKLIVAFVGDKITKDGESV